MSQQETAQSQAKKQSSDRSISQRQAVANKAIGLVGLPWVHCARSAQHGVDCAGLIIVCAESIGINIPDLGNYERLEPQSSVLKYVEEHCRILNSGEEYESGDLILMSWENAPTHLGIYIGDDWMVHSYERHGVTHQQLIPFWRRKIVNVYRIVEKA